MSLATIPVDEIVGPFEAAIVADDVELGGFETNSGCIAAAEGVLSRLLVIDAAGIAVRFLFEASTTQRPDGLVGGDGVHQRRIRLQIFLPRAADSEGPTDDDRSVATRQSQLMDRLPIGYIAACEEIARVCVFLASDDASYFVGQTIYPDGGRMIQSYPRNQEK